MKTIESLIPQLVGDEAAFLCSMLNAASTGGPMATAETLPHFTAPFVRRTLQSLTDKKVSAYGLQLRDEILRKLTAQDGAA